ncbi:hypothetical protein [Mycoplasma nasistruthionis]|uniref:Uncharacterized protein n=1 Tax=Mycoplasma nasistruthionis TaxID=353852 RepID=A0A5B7XVE5_9MOLU|nr:hypothetical protein [Mycoplasma nasistruthionis]QCZ36657.1 hypothetical protein FG904_01320 [Mycoplasma nasistruthionis]
METKQTKKQKKRNNENDDQNPAVTEEPGTVTPQPEAPKYSSEPIINEVAPEKSGGEVNGLQINRYKYLIDIFGLNSQMTLQQAEEKIFSKKLWSNPAGSEINYDISTKTKLNVDTETNSISFAPTGYYKNPSFGRLEEIVTISGFAK